MERIAKSGGQSTKKNLPGKRICSNTLSHHDFMQTLRNHWIRKPSSRWRKGGASPAAGGYRPGASRTGKREQTHPIKERRDPRDETDNRAADGDGLPMGCGWHGPPACSFGRRDRNRRSAGGRSTIARLRQPIIPSATRRDAGFDGRDARSTKAFGIGCFPLPARPGIGFPSKRKPLPARAGRGCLCWMFPALNSVRDHGVWATRKNICALFRVGVR